MSTQETAVDLSGADSGQGTAPANFSDKHFGSKKNNKSVWIIVLCFFLSVVILYGYFNGQREMLTPQIDELPADPEGEPAE